MTTKIRLLHDTVGIPTGAVAVTQSASDNTTKVATTAYVTTALANLADSAPSTLNTLNELAAALGDDANFSTTVTNSIAAKLPLAGGTLTGAVNITGAISSGADTTIATFGRAGGAVSSSIIYADATTDMEFGTTTAHALSLITSDTRRLTITGSGNVGIGTSSPSFAAGSGLEIERAGIATLRLQNSNSKSVEITQDADFKIESMNSGADIILMPTANVGIGTTSPARLLNLQDNSDPTIMLTKQYSNTTGSIGSIVFGNGNWDSSMASIRGIQDGTNDGGKLEFKTQGDASGGEVTRFTIFKTGLSTFNGPAAQVNLGGGSTGSSALYVNSTSGHTGEMIQILKNGATRMHMANDGKLGIGTSSPAAPLDIKFVDNTNAQRWSYGSSEDNFYLELDTAIPAGGVVSYNFNTKTNGTLYNNNLVLDRGKVGIGTASPNAPLEVSGGTAMTGGWGRSLLLRHNFPVMVFQSEYSTDAYAGIAYDNTTGMHFMVNSPTIDIFANSQQPALFIQDDKNIGIGTTSPNIGRLQIHGGGGSGVATLHLQSDTSSQFNHSINSFNSNLTSGENNLFVIGRAGSTRNSAWMGYKYYSAGSYSNCLTFGHWGNNNILNLNGYGIFMGGGLETAPNYPGSFTAARTGSSGTTTEATWGFNATAGGSHKDFGYKAAGTGSYAYGVLNAAETTWMSRLDFGGAIHLTNTTVQSISDRRLKKDIVDANSQWNDIKALQFKNYKWKDENKGTDTYLGLIADEVESVSPGLVGIDAISAETMPEDGNDPEYKNVKYSIVWMKAVKALQEAMAKIETLETKLEAAEARITTLEG